MTEDIIFNISPELVDKIDKMSISYSNNIGSDPKEFYVNYYLNILPHFDVIYKVGNGLHIKPGQHILEVGSGIGTRCLLGNNLYNADFDGLEPCFNSYQPLKEAINELQRANPHMRYNAIPNSGEDTLLPSNTYDNIVSFEVVEHCQNPEKLIGEMYRILRPDGKIFISTCNYSSFYEGHYRCLWLPFLNQEYGKKWVSILGYNPVFINELNLITKNKLLNYLRKAGFKNIRYGYDYSVNFNDMPKLIVKTPNGFNPIYNNTRSSYIQNLIQKNFVRRFLSHFNLEYKLYIEAQK